MTLRIHTHTNLNDDDVVLPTDFDLGGQSIQKISRLRRIYYSAHVQTLFLFTLLEIPNGRIFDMTVKDQA